MTAKKIWFFTLPDEKYVKDDIQSSEYTIIPIDIKSANFLDNLKIMYTKPENYLKSKDYFDIDKTAVKIARNWWRGKNSNLSYCNIQLEYLLEWELIITFTKLLKNLIEINKIVEIEKPDVIIGSSGKNMFKNIPAFIAKKFDIPFQSVAEDNSNKSFHLDTIPVTLRIGSKLVSLNYSNFKKIKTISEKLTKLITTHRRKDAEKLLLLDFNIVLYELLLDDLEKQGLEVFLVNKRRPVIWNKESLKIELKKKYNLVTLDKYSTNDSRDRTNEAISYLNNNLNDLWEKRFFSDQFCFFNLNFWDLIKDNFLTFCKNRMAEAIQDIEFGNNMMKKENFAMVLVWGYALQFEKTMLLLAKKMAIPSLTLQDGVKGGVEYKKFGKRYSPENFEIESNFIASWGKLSKTNYYPKYGIEPERIIEIGSPRYDNLFKIQHKNYPTNNVLLATSGLATSYSENNNISTVKKYEDFIKEICVAIKKFPDKNLIVKLHPFADEIIDVPSVIRQIDKDIKILKNENIQQLIKNSDLVISTHSTVILEAMILGKPTLVINPVCGVVESDDLPYIKSGATLGVDNPNEIEIVLEKFFSNEQIQENILLNSKKFIDEYLANQGNASKELSKFILNYIKEK